MADDLVTPEGGDSQHIPGEKWMPVPSEPGVLASNMGRVLLPPRYAPISRGGFRAYLPKPRYGQVSRAHKNAAHEFRIIMVKRDGPSGRQAPRKVHQLVCEAFHGPKPFPEAVVIHLDEDAHNNRPENLKWGTQKENLNAPKLRASKLASPLYVVCGCCGKRFRRGESGQRFCSSACFGKNSRKITEQQGREMESMLRTGVQQKKIAEIFGVHRSVVFRVKKRISAAEWRA